MAATGVDHEITAVLLSFRAYDTLLESVVLLLAGIVVLALGADRPRVGEQQVPLPSIAGWVIRIAAPVLLMLGLWLLFAGSSGSGGAFQSGSVLAGLLILLHLAGARLRLLHRLLIPLLVVGVLVFLGAGLLGPLTGQPWLTWPGGRQFLFIFLVEAFLTVGITVALYALYLALENPGHRISSGEVPG
jgi:multisubunit Na+/H+ antiporter MnhB subunit